MIRFFLELFQYNISRYAVHLRDVLAMNINNNIVPNNLQRLPENSFPIIVSEDVQFEILSIIDIPTINQVLHAHPTMRATAGRLPLNMLNNINAHDRGNNVIYTGDDGGARVYLGTADDVEKGITAFIAAARDGNLEMINALLEVGGIDINQAAQLGVTALMLAAENGHTDIVHALLGVDGIDVNQAAQHGDGNLQMIDVLRGVGGIDINEADTFGETALMFAAGNGHADIANALLGVGGIDVNQATDFGVTALMEAVRRSGDAQIVNALLGVDGIDVNQADSDGETALTLAVRYDYAEIVNALLEVLEVEGIDVNQADFVTSPRRRRAL